ncbi:hypothetical protein Aam_035_056 [Acidocella aminolytica 101 = DSM 11237]|uniref:Uncharacterized protein n=1 Tax=Acidocella aminolytica 101 = DSM 11237 TaxID=1120923 RepID=A0A0D6PGT7_9PROT|nr:hypothetical protein Aam_035_056 [Acidocella aminolytica 101 = DSM 11237]
MAARAEGLLALMLLALVVLLLGAVALTALAPVADVTALARLVEPRDWMV